MRRWKMAARKKVTKNEWELESLKKRGMAYEKELKKRVEKARESVRALFDQTLSAVMEAAARIPVISK